jgi:hypothetical protein
MDSKLNSDAHGVFHAGACSACGFDGDFYWSRIEPMGYVCPKCGNTGTDNAKANRMVETFTTLPLCVSCRHFHRHSKIVRGPYWSDNHLMVESVDGDCKRKAPTRHWLTGRAVWPQTRCSDSCSEFESKYGSSPQFVGDFG